MSNESEDSIQQNSFADLVQASQQRWINHANLLSVEQSRKLPNSFSQWMYNLVLDHLPDYVSSQTVQQLRQTHPTPLMTVGLLRDKRFQEGTHEGSLPYDLPTHTPLEKILSLAQGMNILDEVVVDTLTHDTITLLIDEAHSLNNPLGKFITTVLSLAVTSHEHESANELGESAVDTFARLTTGDISEFRRSLAKAGVTGNAKGLNDTLKGIAEQTKMDVPNLDSLAIFLGGDLQLTYGTPRARREESLRENMSRSFSTAGQASTKYPGVIEFVTLNKVIPFISFIAEGVGVIETIHDWKYFFIPLVNALPSYLSLRSFAGMFYTAIHEIAHYLCMDTNRRGLPIESHLKQQ